MCPLVVGKTLVWANVRTVPGRIDRLAKQREHETSGSDASCSFATLDGAELREGIPFGDDELAVFVRDVALDVAGVDEVCEHALDLVHVHVHPDGGEAAQDLLQVEPRGWHLPKWDRSGGKPRVSRVASARRRPVAACEQHGVLGFGGAAPPAASRRLA